MPKFKTTFINGKNTKTNLYTRAHVHAAPLAYMNVVSRVATYYYCNTHHTISSLPPR